MDEVRGPKNRRRPLGLAGESTAFGGRPPAFSLDSAFSALSIASFGFVSGLALRRIIAPLAPMGKLVWHDLSRLLSIAASIYAIWAGFWGILFRKFFWDIIGGIIRNPGGIQPSPEVHVFITVIVKHPIVQILAMVMGFVLLSLEYPLPFVEGLPIHRSIPLRIVLLVLQSFLAVLFYQGTNASLWSLIAAVFYVRALALGERVAGPKPDAVRAGQP